MRIPKAKLLVLVVALFLAAAFVPDGFLGFQYYFQSCKKPMSYALGTFDTRFGITGQYFLSALSEAEAIWEEAAGRELFVHKPENGEIAINLVYDYRQEVTSALSELEEEVEEDEASYHSLQSQYLKLKADYANAKSIYDARVEVFNEKNDDYQDDVEAWNNGKRNSRSQLEQLEAQRKELETEIVELKALEAKLNDMVGKINQLVNRLNRLARTLNLNVETYNTIGASRGETFTGGLYYSAGGKQGIDVYEFSSRDKLVRILAHELGHALGLEHVDDPEAMMYHLNNGEAGALTETDKSALQALCGIE